ncbi:MAG: hypothetical protein ACI9LX_002799 [Paraglaciecola sp.]|jgi:hypothetical protein
MPYSFALLYLRLKARQLFLIYRRVKLDFLEARLRPIEQLDREVEIGCRSSGMCY